MDLDRTESGQVYSWLATTLTDGIGPSAIPEPPTKEEERQENILVGRPAASPAGYLGKATECDREALGMNKGLQGKVNLEKPKAEPLGRFGGDADQLRDTQEARAHANPTTACGVAMDCDHPVKTTTWT